MNSGMLAEPTLVGREHELAELQRHLQLATEGKGTTVFVSGEAGCGKTRLIAEFLDLAKKKDVLVLAGWCLSNAAQPYFPFVEAFQSYYSTVDSGVAQQQELKSWLVGRGQTEGREITPQMWKDQTFAAITRELLYMSTNKPIILFIEDMHWADSASLVLLHYIARAITSERLLVVATFRPEEIAAKLEGHPHPLSEALRLMAREELFKEIKLQNLDTVNVGKIAENMLGGSLDQIFIERLSEESHGNPLFVVEALRMMYAQGSLVQEHGQWRLTNESIEIPAKVKDVIMRRLDALKPNQRRILDAASVIGEKFDPKLLADVFPQDSLDVFEGLNSVAQSTLLVFCEGNNYRFKHAKIQEMLYNEIPPLLKREYHSRIAASLEDSSQNAEPFPFSDLAYHYAQAGNKVKAIQYSLQAGKFSLARFSNSEAIKHFTYVLKATENEAPHINERVSALEGLGDAFYANSMFKEAADTFELLGNVGTDVLKLRASRKAMESAFQLGDRPRLMELLRKAEQYVGADRLETARVLMSKGRTFTLQTNIPASIENFEAALQIFEEEYSLWDVGFALVASGTCKAHHGMQKQGIAECLRAIAIFEELGDFRWQLEAYCTAGYSFGDFLLEHEAFGMFEKVIETNDKMKMGDFLWPVLANAFSSRLFEQIRDFDKMLACSLKALELAEKTDSITAHASVYSYLLMQYALLGDVNRSEQYFEKLMQLPAEILSHPYVFAALANIVLCAEQGRWKKSNQLFNEYLDRTKVVPGYIARGKLYYAWSLEKQGLYEEARTLLDDVKKLRQEAEKRFERADLQANLMVRRQVAVGEEFEMRLDLINVARNPGNLVRVEGLVPAGCKVTSMPSFCQIQNSLIEMNQKRIGPFQVETIKLKATFAKEGDYKVEPCVIYVDNLGEARKTNVEPITMTSQLSSSGGKLEGVIEPLQGKLAFKSEAAEKTFNFLMSAFIEDYIHRRLPQEKSGWRTLMQIVKNGHISKHGLYGQSGRGGEVTSQLERLGLIETRFFSGERGRGGHIHKVRVCYEREIVKRQIGREETEKK